MDSTISIQRNSKLEQILEAVSFYRGIVLDSVEQELGHEGSWKFLRARLLRAFGDHGLEHRIRKIMGGTDGNNIE